MRNKLEKINNKLEELFSITEMSMAWRSIQNNRCVWVENPTGYNNKYFKYLNGPSYKKASKVARISLMSPTYLNHKNADGKDNWILTTKEKKELVTLMQENNKTYPTLTNWQVTLLTYNWDNFELDVENIINRTYDKQKFPNVIDIDTPMPDYTKL